MLFNGEIYNFQSLKNLLHGHQWCTQSDSEVVVELLNNFGLSALAHLDGMYAIAWYKKSIGELVLPRDPLGFKTLCVFDQGGSIFFSPEINSLTAFCVRPEICKTDFVEFLNFGYTHESRIGFSNISKISPGQSLVWKDGQSRTEIGIGSAQKAVPCVSPKYHKVTSN